MVNETLQCEVVLEAVKRYIDVAKTIFLVIVFKYGLGMKGAAFLYSFAVLSDQIKAVIASNNYSTIHDKKTKCFLSYKAVSDYSISYHKMFPSVRAE